jgi:hypothetical protein
MITALTLGVLSAMGDGILKHPSPVPYIMGGLGLLGGLSYICLLILSKWVD